MVFTKEDEAFIKNLYSIKSCDYGELTVFPEKRRKDWTSFRWSCEKKRGCLRESWTEDCA